MVSEGRMNLWNVVNEILDKAQLESADRDGNLAEPQTPAWQNQGDIFAFICVLHDL